MYEVLQFVFSLIPLTANTGMYLLFKMSVVFPEYSRVDHSWDVLNIPHYIDQYHRESEIAVPVGDCSGAIHDVFNVKDKYEIPMTHIVEVMIVITD